MKLVRYQDSMSIGQATSSSSQMMSLQSPIYWSIIPYNLMRVYSSWQSTFLCYMFTAAMFYPLCLTMIKSLVKMDSGYYYLIIDVISIFLFYYQFSALMEVNTWGYANGSMKMLERRQQNWSVMMSFFFEETNSTNAFLRGYVMIILMSLRITRTQFPSQMILLVKPKIFSARRCAKVILPIQFTYIFQTMSRPFSQGKYVILSFQSTKTFMLPVFTIQPQNSYFSEGVSFLITSYILVFNQPVIWYFQLIQIWKVSSSSFLGQLTDQISGKVVLMYYLRFQAFLPLPCTRTT